MSLYRFFAKAGMPSRVPLLSNKEIENANASVKKSQEKEVKSVHTWLIYKVSVKLMFVVIKSLKQSCLLVVISNLQVEYARFFILYMHACKCLNYT